MEATEIKYQTSYEDCQKKIVGVCSCCGGELKPLETVDNAGRPTWWSGCEPCNRFDYGVSPEVYAIAKYMVDDAGHISYPHMTRPGKGQEIYADYYRKSQICGAASLVVKIFRIQKQLAEQATT